MAGTLTTFARCESNSLGRTRVRSGGDARCAGKRHVVSGGFAIEDADSTLAVAAFLDESHPVGRKGWHLGMSELPGINLPVGATLETLAYCKRIPGAKGKKRKR
ncbi:MAG: hypothetical protein ACRDKH_02490 [Solirubrobacterales bacterium]